MNYDLIGDVHGSYDLLIKLLEELSYQKLNGVWQHPSRKALFMGDLINRGPNSRAVLHLVKKMHETGNAVVILGNHEFNFVCWHMQRRDGSYLRPHTPHNLKQVTRTLEDFENYPDEIPYFINWMRSLPLYFETDDFRAVHACWDDKYIQQIRVGTFRNDLSDDQFIHQSVLPGNPAFDLIERLLKGVEYRLPHGLDFKDNDGKLRHHVRIKWWEASMNSSLHELSFIQFNTDRQIPNDPNFVNELPTYNELKPLFLGHYCLPGNEPELLTSSIACLDYCSYKRNRLTAYQFNGGMLNTRWFHQVSKT